MRKREVELEVAVEQQSDPQEKRIKAECKAVQVFHQPLLIEPEKPLFETLLVAADSPRCAFYRVGIYRLAGAGYMIKKSSGAKDAKPNEEYYYRPSLVGALDKRDFMITMKLKKKSGTRIYISVGEVNGVIGHEKS
jgi:hypothetical protein